MPRDMSIVGFDDVPEGRHFIPPLTTVRQDFTAIGRAVVAQIVRQLTLSGMTAAEQLPVELIIRDSTGPLLRS